MTGIWTGWTFWAARFAGSLVQIEKQKKKERRAGPGATWQLLEGTPACRWLGELLFFGPWCQCMIPLLLLFQSPEAGWSCGDQHNSCKTRVKPRQILAAWEGIWPYLCLNPSFSKETLVGALKVQCCRSGIDGVEPNGKKNPPPLNHNL